MRAWTKVILAGKRDNSRHPTMIFSKNFVVFFFGNRGSNVRGFTILWSGDGLTSFKNLVLESKSLFYGSDSKINILNPRTYTQIHTPTVVQGGGGWWNPSLKFLICCSICKWFCLQWKSLDLVNKVRYILWVVALLEACDVTNSCHHLGRHLRM